MLRINYCQPSEPDKKRKPLMIPFDNNTTVESAVDASAKLVDIRPVCVPLLALKIIKLKLWLAPSQLLKQLPLEVLKCTDNNVLDVQLRIRFRPQSLLGLEELDIKCFNYLFYQVRHDFLLDQYSMSQEEGLGLCVTDILHHMHNTGEKVNEKTFLPRSLNNIFNQHNVTKHVKKNMADAAEATATLIKRKYLEQAEEGCTQVCLTGDGDNLGLVGGEEMIVEDVHGDESSPVRLMVQPFHPLQPGIRCSKSKKGGWSVVCTIEQLVAISCRWSDQTVELARRSGVPCYYQVGSIQALWSLVSAITGYYRLISCWTFDLCREVPTPSIKELRKAKCHGPVGSVFGLNKLRTRAGDEVGAALLRQSSRCSDVYKLDIVTAADATTAPARTSAVLPVKTLVIRHSAGCFTIENVRIDKQFETLTMLVRYLMDINKPRDGSETTNDSGGRRVTRLLPPSDYDDRPELLLLCAAKEHFRKAQEDQGPRVFRIDSLLPVSEDASDVITGSFYRIVHAKKASDVSKEIAVKNPSLPSQSHTNRFLQMCDEWFKLSDCDAVVMALGVTLQPQTIVMEWVPLGPLDVYLKSHQAMLETVDLLEAVTHLAKALYFLSVEGIQHNNIRCHSLLVAKHEKNQFKVKLSEPGHPLLDDASIHWLPQEHHAHPPTSKNDPSTDVWAFATTAWQIYSGGIVPLEGQDLTEAKALYAAGRLLPKPANCPTELYQIMRRCWVLDPTSRRQPQTIMRDTFQILYQVFNSRRNNAYCSIPDDDDSPTTEYTAVNVQSSKHFNNPLYNSADHPSSPRSPSSPHSPSSPNRDYQGTSSIATTLTTIDSSQTLVHFSDDEDAGPTIAPTFPPIGSMQAALGALPPLGSSLFHLPDACLARETGAFRLPPIIPLPQQPPPSLSLRQLLVAPSVVESGQLVEGQVLRMGSCSVRIETAVGEGNYGWVYRGHLTAPHRPRDGIRDGPVAVKTLKLVTGQLDDMVREIDIMKVLIHPRIVRLLGVITQDSPGQDERLFMVMEYLHMGSLKAYLQRNPNITDTTLLNFAIDVASGMDYLESRQIVHRDLAARNLLVESPEHVKISDFGLAQQLHSSAYYILRTKRDLPLAWYSPESIVSLRYSHKSDVWSYGVTCWEMFTRGQEPNLPRDPELLLTALKQGTRLLVTPPCPEKVYLELIRICWDHDPDRRPDFAELATIAGDIKVDMM